MAVVADGGEKIKKKLACLPCKPSLTRPIFSGLRAGVATVFVRKNLLLFWLQVRKSSGSCRELKG